MIGDEVREVEFRVGGRDEGVEESRYWLGVNFELCSILEVK